ncbi:adenosylcobinamide-GDP ribazoletransferase [Desulfohalotomaculum tongense]|uniref:adenosylcobinamide-GDP ribazoletransferase n=1 Tax=Desulforadius tongensis TaxID=1216062 RepID=UPI00195C72F5|nr:adenosylcobinamide-GDP ribazoletransferase [Desulforadius tongensis]
MRGLILATGFLTVLPVGRNIQAAERDIGRSLGWFPTVGLILGGIAAGWCYILHLIGLNLAADAAAVLSLVILTGGLHWDGLMDTADGLLSYREREQMLAIMKDSSVGAMGVLAALCVLLLKIAFVFEIPMPDKLHCLVLAPVISRASMVYSITGFPYARKKGTGSIFAHHAGKSQLALAAVTAAAVTALLYRPWGLILLALGFGFSLLVSRYVCRRLGGLTGDVYGAVTELTEAAVIIMGALVCQLF